MASGSAVVAITAWFARPSRLIRSLRENTIATEALADRIKRIRVTGTS